MIKDIKQVIQFIHSANSEDTDLIVQAINQVQKKPIA